MRQQAEQAQLMAKRKQDMQYQAWQEEQGRAQAAQQLRQYQVEQGGNRGAAGYLSAPPPVMSQPNGPAPAPAPGFNSAQQAPTASPGGPPPQPSAGSQPQGNPVPAYRTVANTNAPTGQPQGQGAGPMTVPPVQPQQPTARQYTIDEAMQSFRKQGLNEDEQMMALKQVMPVLQEQDKQKAAAMVAARESARDAAYGRRTDLMEKNYASEDERRKAITAKGGAELAIKERKAGMGGAGGGGSGGMGGPTGEGKSDADKKLMEFYALSQLSGDSSWKTGMSRGKEGARIIAMVERYVPQLAEKLGVSPTDVIANKGGIQANVKALMDATKREAGIELGMNALDGHIKNLDKLLDKTSAKGGAIIINKPINAIRRASSDPDIAQLDLAAQQVATEYERVLQGGSLSIAQLHQGAAEDAKKLLNGDMTPEQIRAIIPVMRQEMEMSKAGAKKTTKDLQDRIRQPLAGQGASGGDGKVMSLGEYLKSKGH